MNLYTGSNTIDISEGTVNRTRNTLNTMYNKSIVPAFEENMCTSMYRAAFDR